MADLHAPPEGSEPPWLYVCENCGRLGPMTDFREECRPGWAHGRLLRVYPERCSERVAAAVRDLLGEEEPSERPTCPRGTYGCDIEHEPDDAGPCFGSEERSHG